jgi:hypothetical protein
MTEATNSNFYIMQKIRYVFSLLLIGAAALSGCSTTPPQNAADNASTPAANAATNSATNAITPTSKSGVETFANSPQGLQGPLKENYVDFSFDYPATWEIKGEAGDPAARNFIKVERQLADKSKGEFTLENFAVGTLKIKDAAARDPQRLSQAVNMFSEQIAAKYPNYKKISEGPAKVNNYKGYELRFESRSPQSTRGPVTLWGRIVLLPHPKEAKGVTLIMQASSLAPEIKNASDVGVKGGLPVILKSFKFQ